MAVDPERSTSSLAELNQNVVDRRVKVIEELQKLRSAAVGEYLSASPLVNSLLDLWAVAIEVDVQVAQPVETMLTALMGRHLVGTSEVLELCDNVEAALNLQPAY